jgi:hypothetical protein
VCLSFPPYLGGWEKDLAWFGSRPSTWRGGENHEHIARVRWTNPQTGDSGQSTREQMIEYLRKPGTRAFVTDGERTVNIRIVEAEPPYIRTHADGVWTNNLLALPRYGPM